MRLTEGNSFRNVSGKPARYGPYPDLEAMA